MNRLRVLRDCVKTRSPCLRSCYRDAVSAAEETRIRVENIQGAVLLLSAEDDTMWPSYEAARGITCFRWKAAGTNCLPTPAVTRRTTWPPPATRWRRRLTFSTAGNRAKAV